MATRPTFPNPGHLARISVSTANTASDGSGTINALLKEDNTTDFSGNASGSIVGKISFTNAQAALAASSAMVIRVFASDSAGANWRLIKESSLAAATRSASAVGAGAEINLGIEIGSGVKIGVVQSIYAGVQDLTHYTLEYADAN